MARYTITTEGEEALAAATAETVLLVAGSTSAKGHMWGFGFAFDGVTAAAEPVQWKLKRGNSASQGTSSAATEEKRDPDEPAAILTGFHSFSGEPTYTGQPLMAGEIHPQGGVYEWRAVDVAESFVLDDSANSFFGLELTAPAVVNVQAWMEVEP